MKLNMRNQAVVFSRLHLLPVCFITLSLCLLQLDEMLDISEMIMFASNNTTTSMSLHNNKNNETQQQGSVKLISEEEDVNGTTRTAGITTTTSTTSTTSSTTSTTNSDGSVKVHVDVNVHSNIRNSNNHNNISSTKENLDDGDMDMNSADIDMDIDPKRSFQNGNMQKKGGTIIFYHVAKTGGSTVRSFFQSLHWRDRSRFKYSRYVNSQNRAVHANVNVSMNNSTCVPPGTKQNKMEGSVQYLINAIKNGNNNVTHLWEIHGGSPGLDVVAPYISHLRKLSQEHNKTFFAFTMVREPLSYTESYFKFFHVNCRQTWCEHKQYDRATEMNMLETAISHPNQQCFLLKHSSSVEGMHPSFYNKCRVTPDECDTIYENMKDTLDWVGTTDQLSMDTLPLLKYLVDDERGNNENGVRPVRNKKVAKKLPFEDSLSNRTLATLSNVTALDQNLYDRVKSDFVLADMFPNVQERVRRLNVRSQSDFEGR